MPRSLLSRHLTFGYTYLQFLCHRQSQVQAVIRLPGACGPSWHMQLSLTSAISWNWHAPQNTSDWTKAAHFFVEIPNALYIGQEFTAEVNMNTAPNMPRTIYSNPPYNSASAMKTTPNSTRTILSHPAMLWAPKPIFCLFTILSHLIIYTAIYLRL